MAPSRVWRMGWLAPSVVPRLGLASRWLVRWLGFWLGLGLACWCRSLRNRVGRRKLLLELPSRWLWSGLLQRVRLLFLLVIRLSGPPKRPFRLSSNPVILAGFSVLLFRKGGSSFLQITNSHESRDNGGSVVQARASGMRTHGAKNRNGATAPVSEGLLQRSWQEAGSEEWLETAAQKMREASLLPPTQGSVS